MIPLLKNSRHLEVGELLMECGRLEGETCLQA